jgi:Arc/MetJ-type ribon-helix-helix transcriptional regulator
MAGKQKKPNRTYVSLSFSVPPELEAPMNQRAADAGFRSRSEYICKLVEDDLRKAGVLKAQPPGKRKLPRIVRGRKPLKNISASKSASDV